MKGEFSTEGDYYLWGLISQVSDLMTMARSVDIKPYGITAAQVKLLGILQYREEALSISELAVRLQRTHHGVSALVKRMIKDNLIHETDSKEPRNKRVIAITEKGKHIYEQSRRNSIIHNILSIITKRQKEQFIDQLIKIRDNAVKTLHTHSFSLFKK
ncbi:MarR family winged helix-turn-helix transcriptional regulator [Chloroflexota bacterium]